MDERHFKISFNDKQEVTAIHPSNYDLDGEVKHDNITYIGDEVFTKFGLSKIKKIELMPEPRHYSKCGISVNKMFTKFLDHCIIDLENGHFVYGDELDNTND